MTHGRGNLSTWPWHLFAALVVASAACLAAHALIKPVLSLSSPVVSFQDGAYQAAFQATNNADQAETAVLQVIFSARMADSAGEGYLELARTKVVVRLAAKEKKPLCCVFSAQVPFLSLPTARAEVASLSSP